MSLLSNFQIDANFWETYPLMRVPEAFALLYNEDKTKDKRESSKLMWAVAMLVDISDTNKYRNLREEDRKKLICEDYLGRPEYNWDLLEPAIETYKHLHLSKDERILVDLERKVEERTKFIIDTEYSLEEGDKLDKLFANTDKIFNIVKDLRADIEKQKNAGTLKGGRTESISEQKLI